MLRAFIEDNPKNLDNLGEMDKFLAGYTPSTELLTACHCEHCSGDPHKEHKNTHSSPMDAVTLLEPIIRG